MGETKVVVEQDSKGRGFLVITCPDCESVTRLPFLGLKPGDTVPCGCGNRFNFSGDDLDALERNPDALVLP